VLVRHYRWRSPSPDGFAAGLLFGVRLDYHDLRSGYLGTDSGWYAAPHVGGADPDWAPDAVAPVAAERLEEVAPPEQSPWPSDADERITRYFEKHRRQPIWRNLELSLYSRPRESRADFIHRCLETLVDQRRAALLQVRDLFLRRFLESEERNLRLLEEGDWSPEDVDHRAGEIRRVFSEIRDSFSRCFLHDDGRRLTESDLTWEGKLDIEGQERLESLRDEFLDRYKEVTRSFPYRAKRIEPYEISVNSEDIEIVSRGFLSG
jgi:hypothetical protein